jgi:hypothetical protein
MKVNLSIPLRMSDSSIKKTFKGPSHWHQTRGEYIPYRKPDIVSVSMEWGGIIYEIPYSNLIVSVKHEIPHILFLHFMFDYIQDGVRHSGRWYDTTVSPNILKEITNNTLTYGMNDFTDHATSETPVVCTTRITFRPTVAAWLKMLGETRPSPPVPSQLDTLLDYWDTLYYFCTRPLCSCTCRRRHHSR